MGPTLFWVAFPDQTNKKKKQKNYRWQELHDRIAIWFPLILYLSCNQVTKNPFPVNRRREKTFSKCRLTRPSVSRQSSPRRWSRIVQFHNGLGWELATQSATTPSAVTGGGPSSSSKLSRLQFSFKHQPHRATYHQNFIFKISIRCVATETCLMR